MKAVPGAYSAYANQMEHVESRFGTLDGAAEWIVAVCHVRSGSKKQNNQVTGSTPLQAVKAKQRIARQALALNVKTLDGSSRAIGCVLLGNFNLTLA